jgi:serine/threonine protein kinase
VYHLEERWPGIELLPEYANLNLFRNNQNSNMRHIYYQQASCKSEAGYNFLNQMLEYDPNKRITADAALLLPYFIEEPKPSMKYVSFSIIL